jgi:hypothetical protein
MTVIDQSVAQDKDARSAMYRTVLQIIHGTMGTTVNRALYPLTTIGPR